MIVATKGRDFQSDIAIDDLSVNFESNCTPMSKSNNLNLFTMIRYFKTYQDF